MKDTQERSIAILSMQRVVNFGSVLQAYALRKLISEQTGAQVKFLDIEDTPALAVHRTVTEQVDYAAPAAYPKGIFQRGKRFIIAKLSSCNKKRIRAFMKKELNLREENSQTSYDAVVVGSDEVFNHVKGLRLQLHGEIKQAGRVISYAASCGSARAGDIAPADRERVKGAMQRFSALSVRDEATERYVSVLSGGECVRHLDPVLVGDIQNRKHPKVWLKNYLLVYAYGQRIRTAQEIAAIQDFAQKKGLKTLAIGGSQFWCDCYLPVSPWRAMDYFYHADFVVTDTFHGSIFSVIHHKKFAVIPRKTNENKLGALLHDLHLEERLLPHMGALEQVLTREIDYNTVDEILARERERTQAYLREQLGGGV